MENVHILLFYKFVKIEDPQSLQLEHLQFCKKIGVKGKVLLGEEGINGSVSGSKEQVEAYKKGLTADARFSDIIFKEELGTHHPFRRMLVRVRNEIIRLGTKVDLTNTGTYLEPTEFMEVADDAIVLDTRNDYEWAVGKFKNAITLPIKTFREFPKAVEKLEHLKDKKIVMYCTGGIRCEKASAYMKEQGFKDVSQLHGGIITFCQEKPNTLWEGSCFVFDNRLVSRVNNETDPISSCESCGAECDLYRNCSHVKCNRLVILCPSCTDARQGCCSSNCFEKHKQSWHLAN